MSSNEAIKILEEYINIHETEEYSNIVQGEVEAIRMAIDSLRNRNTLCDLYVLDKQTFSIHRIGEDAHDCLEVWENGIVYMNLQNGDGGNEKDCKTGYVILRSEYGSLINREGQPIDKRFECTIRKYLEERGHDFMG